MNCHGDLISCYDMLMLCRGPPKDIVKVDAGKCDIVFKTMWSVGPLGWIVVDPGCIRRAQILDATMKKIVTPELDNWYWPLWLKCTKKVINMYIHENPRGQLLTPGNQLRLCKKRKKKKNGTLLTFIEDHKKFWAKFPMLKFSRETPTLGVFLKWNAKEGLKLAHMGIFRHIEGVWWVQKNWTSKYIGSRAIVPKLVDLGPLRAPHCGVHNLVFRRRKNGMFELPFT